MKLSVLIPTLLFLMSCGPKNEVPTDDYVLIEFASKLEEDQKIQQANQLDQSLPSLKQP